MIIPTVQQQTCLVSIRECLRPYAIVDGPRHPWWDFLTDLDTYLAGCVPRRRLTPGGWIVEGLRLMAVPHPPVTVPPPLAAPVSRHRYAGQLLHQDWGEAPNILFLSSDRTRPLAEILGWLAGHQVSVRYWLTSQEVTWEVAETAFLRMCFGEVDVELQSHYSEITGYLWTDEALVIGGHDLLAEFEASLGQWLLLDIDVVELSSGEA